MSINFNNINSSASLRSLFNSTISLNTTMQRLSTGLRINSAADNAANLGLSKKIDSKISGLNVANNNIQTGISKLQTLDGYMGGIANNLQRIRDLAVQASNGTYSSSERSMIDKEAQAILGEVEQASNQANTDIGASRTNVTGLINDVTQITEANIPGGYTAIKTAAQFKTAINAGLSGKYMLMNDIDMSELGTVNQAVITSGDFTGILDGNGYKIKNLTINSTVNKAGLFAQTNGATIKNIILDNTTVKSHFFYSGSLIGTSDNTTIDNVASTNINITGSKVTGGLVGEFNDGSISSSYTTGNVFGTQSTGGLAGGINADITSSYASVNVIGSDAVGGLAGSFGNCTITSSYATGNVSGANNIGGLVGQLFFGNITSSYATGNISGGSSAGGLLGDCIASSTITSSYATGNVSGGDYIGGFVGIWESGAITSCYATGNASGNDQVGGFAGGNYDTITSSYATGVASGMSKVGGFIGINDAISVNSCYSTGSASGITSIGGFVGED